MPEKLENAKIPETARCNVAEKVNPGAVEAKQTELTHPTIDVVEMQIAMGWILPPTVTRKQMVELGRENLQHAQQILRRTLAKARPIRKKQQKMLKLLDGRSIEQLQKIAQWYNYPQVGVCQSKWEGEKLMPSSAEARNLAAGSTTLRACGWCKYAIPYHVPYNVVALPNEQRVFRPSCGFCCSQWNAEHEHDFDTPCILTRSQKRTDEICQQLQERHWEFIKYYDKLAQYINYLSALIAEAESKPLFPKYRSLRHYAEGTPVYYFRSAYQLRAAPSPPYPFRYCMTELKYDIWRGEIVGHVQDYDGMVQVLFDKDEQPTALNFTDESLVSFDELAYLMHHPEYTQTWLAASERQNTFLLDALMRYQKDHYLSTRV